MQANRRLTGLLVALKSPCGLRDLRYTPTFPLPNRNNADWGRGGGVGAGGVCMHKGTAEERLCLFPSSLGCSPSPPLFLQSSRGHCGGPGVSRGLGGGGGGCASSSSVGYTASNSPSSSSFDRAFLVRSSSFSSVLHSRLGSPGVSPVSVGGGCGVSSAFSSRSPVGLASFDRVLSSSSPLSALSALLPSSSGAAAGGAAAVGGGGAAGGGVCYGLGCMRQSVRFKMVKSSSYRRPSRASPTGQSQKAHIGVCRLSAEYVSPGCILVRQRRYIAWGFESKRRRRHKKIYPGENVGVAKNSSLVALVYGRVKYTHDVSRDVMLCNVLPEEREELLRTDLWRYRTEHVQSKEENRHICHLRRKAVPSFGKPLVNPPTKPLPRPKFLSRFDSWENPTLPDAPSICENR